MLFVHKFNKRERERIINIFALYSLPIIFSKIFSASIAFYPPLRNESMQCALPTPFIYIFSFFSHYLLTDSFQNSLKTRIKLHKIAYTTGRVEVPPSPWYTMSKNCLRRGWQITGESKVARFPKPKYGRFLHPFPGAQWPRTLFLLLFLFDFLGLLLLSDFPVPKALSFLNRS